MAEERGEIDQQLEAGADIVSLRPETYRINGVAMVLGGMSLEHLQEIQEHCKQRITDAQHDAQTIEEVIRRVFPEGDGAA